MINRVILLLALLVASTNAGFFGDFFGGSDEDQKQKRVERNQKGKRETGKRNGPSKKPDAIV